MAEATLAEPDDRIQETQFSRQPELGAQEVETSTLTNGQTINYATIQSMRPPKASKSTVKSPRVLGPDLLRGLLMCLQAIDHSAMSAGAWNHGQAMDTEGEEANVDTWNNYVGWTARSLTHLCAPGFMFLLGMGVVYFGRSRSKLGWTTFAMVKHFFVRGLVLALVNEVVGVVLTMGRFYLLNIVLLALAINYFLAGLLWLAINGSETAIAKLLSSKVISSRSTEQETRPLLADDSPQVAPAKSTDTRAAQISFHLHNAFLLAATILTIWMNMWMSPHGGHCDNPTRLDLSAFEPRPSVSGRGAWFDFWFYTVNTGKVMSGFPPLAWLSFAILGILYARLVLSKPGRSPQVINATTLAVGVLLWVVFALMRIGHFGNLSEDCLHMPEHIGAKNQYLASFRSFFYVVKYPPSPAFFCYSMGLNFILLAAFGSIPEKAARKIPGLLVFGTSALFFYVLHIPLYGVLGTINKALFAYDVPGLNDPMLGGPAKGVGPGLAFWAEWLIGLAILYPLCRWYGSFKSRRGPDSVFRFF